MVKIIFVLAAAAACVSCAATRLSTDHGGKSVEAFNRSLIAATTRMDNTAMIALWEDDGVSLLPATAPILGKLRIARFLAGISAQFPHARMQSFDLHCFDIETSGDWESEWCLEHQVISLTEGRPVFDGRGKMLLVLHRERGHAWRIHSEMWNAGRAKKG